MVGMDSLKQYHTEEILHSFLLLLLRTELLSICHKVRFNEPFYDLIIL